MFTSSPTQLKWLALVALLFYPGLLVGANDDFAAIAKRTFADHAKHYQAGDIKACMAMYAPNAKFFVDNKPVASGHDELLEFYRRLREVDAIIRIEFDPFVDVGSKENAGWVVFNYTKEYDLKRHREFAQRHKWEAYSTLKARQHGTALFVKSDGQWKVRLMTVFDPEIWEPQK